MLCLGFRPLANGKNASILLIIFDNKITAAQRNADLRQAFCRTIKPTD